MGESNGMRELFKICQLPDGRLHMEGHLQPPELNLLLDQIKLQLIQPPKQSGIVVPPPGTEVRRAP